jgi:preprotein translocase subunit SecF
MVIPFFKYRKIYYFFSFLLISFALFSIFFFKLNLGVEIKGGSILEVEYLGKRPKIEEIKQKIAFLNLPNFIVQSSGDRGIILKAGEIDERKHQEILEVLKSFGELKEIQFESIGPAISKELREKSILIVLFSVFIIIIYLVLAFKKISLFISPLKYTFAIIFCLLHDLILPLGILSFFGKYLKFQITIPVIIAFLTIVGYSINNVVVVYDRFREIISKFPKKPLSQLIDEAISQTLTRQINTSLTTLFPLFSILFFVGGDLKFFSLALILGILFGTYSSIFLALPLLGSWQKLKNNPLLTNN